MQKRAQNREKTTSGDYYLDRREHRFSMFMKTGVKVRLCHATFPLFLEILALQDPSTVRPIKKKDFFDVVASGGL